MLNKLWAGLIIIAAVCGLSQAYLGGPKAINLMADAIFTSAKNGFDAALGLGSALVLWLGIFEIALAAGVVATIARAMSPVLSRLMPDVPKNHPAFASMSMNAAMGMLGIDNGALPSALKTIEQLGGPEVKSPHTPHAMLSQASLAPKSAVNASSVNASPINTNPLGSNPVSELPAQINSTEVHEVNTALPALATGTANRAQQMFLVYMACSVTVFPVSILGHRLQAGAAHPADVFLPLLIASYVGLFVGMAYMASVLRIRILDPVLVGSALLLVALFGGLTYWVGTMPPKDISPFVALAGNAVLLFFVIMFVVIGLWRGVPVYDTFLKGATKGFAMAVELIPYLVGMLFAIGLLRASGAFTVLQHALEWLSAGMGMDTRWVQEVPHGIMKAFSGGGARAMMLDTFKTQGPDSFAGHLSSIVQGASDTTFYVLAVCAGAAGLKNLGHAVAGAIIANVASFAAAVGCAYLFFA